MPGGLFNGNVISPEPNYFQPLGFIEENAQNFPTIEFLLSTYAFS
jgi:hypothetical protein